MRLNLTKEKIKTIVGQLAMGLMAFIDNLDDEMNCKDCKHNKTEHCSCNSSCSWEDTFGGRCSCKGFK